MRSILFGLFCFAFSFSHAQNEMPGQRSTIKANQTSPRNSILDLRKPDSSITEGFRLGISKPFYSTSLDIYINSPGFSVQDTDDPGVDYTNGLKFGYAHLPVRAFGYIADFDFLEVSIGDKSANLARLAGNVAFAFTSQFNVHGGFNRTDLVSKGASKWDAGVGTQIGVGYQFTRQMGFELNYTVMNLSQQIPFDLLGTSAQVGVDFRLRGYDLNFVATF